MRKLIRLLGKIALVLVGILLAYGLIGTGLSLIPVNGTAASGNDVVIYIAAGTRSFDINMPKEINRLVIDGLSDILFTAGISNNSIANKEGAELSKVYMVGNVLIDNIRFLNEKMVRPDLMNEQGLEEGIFS